VKKLPEGLLQSLENAAGFDRNEFVSAHEQQPAPVSIRLNRTKLGGSDNWPFAFTAGERVPWAEDAYYLERRPSFTFDPLFHGGLYYVQEASSMFLEQAITQLTDRTTPVRALDLCAAPGGKSTHLLSLLPRGSLLVSNEVIRTRSHILSDNIIKWGYENCIVTSNDPAGVGKLHHFFDLAVVDAPCSGSGLFRKDPEAINEWSEGAVTLCSQRQQRILADMLPALKEGGLLVYSTCSYSVEEDEQIADWLVTDIGLEPLTIQVDESWGIVRSQSPIAGATGYRFYPGKVRGEGFFLAAFRKKEGASATRKKNVKIEKAGINDKTIWKQWIDDGGLEILKTEKGYIAFPENLFEDFALVKSHLYPVYTGVELGEIMKSSAVPHHALALSNRLRQHVPHLDLDLADAISYLQRADITADGVKQGWTLVRFAGKPLGWAKVLPQRINNYYPKELRILKQQNDSPFEK